MDIMLADNAKLKVRLFAYFLQKELEKRAKEYGIEIPEGKSFIDAVHDDLKCCSNQGVRKAYKKLIEAGSFMKEQHQTHIVTDLGSCFLWFVLKDTAYRDPFFWIINELVKDESFENDIQSYVHKPEEWYCYNWNKSKQMTKEMHDNSLLPNDELSDAEKVYVPVLQQQEWEKTRKEIEKQMQLHKR